MPTLRDRVRETLSASEPGERAAARDLETILDRAKSRGRTKPRVRWPLLLAPALVAAALASPLLLPRHEPKSGVHLYLNITGEPPERAIALDLDSKGEL